MRTASVAGERFSVWAISPMVEKDEDEIEEACEGLVQRRQFLKATGICELANGELSSHYDFQHSMYREVLYRRLSDVARTRLHLLLAQRLKAFCDPCEQELATELALHFEGGRDYEEAIRHLFLAAKNAVRRFAYRDSIETLNHALELVEKVARGDRGELEIQTLVQIGDTHYALGNMAGSAEAFEKAASRAAYGGLDAVQVAALIRLVHPMGLIDVDRAVAAIEQAQQISARLDDAKLHARVQLLAACARLYYHAWSSQDAEEFHRATETLRRLSAPGPLQYPEMHYAHLNTLEGNFPEALRIAEDGISKINETTNAVSVLLAIGHKALALMHMGQLGKALQMIRAAIAQAVTNGNDPWLLTIREAWLRTTALDYEGAEALCETMIRSNSRYPKGQPQAIGWFSAGNSALAQAKFQDAVENFNRVLDVDLTPKFFLHWIWRIQAHLGLANTRLASGNLTSARVEADHLLQSALATADPNLRVLAWDLQARVAIAEENWKDAAKSLEEGRSILPKFEIPTVAWRIHATGRDLHRLLKNEEAAEIERKRAEECIFKLANSFEQDEPLRATFLGAGAVRRVLQQKVAKKSSRLRSPLRRNILT